MDHAYCYIIADEAFKFCEALTEMDLSRAFEIGKEAFHSTDLQTVNLSNCETVSDEAFAFCKMTTLTLYGRSDNMARVRREAFKACTSLRDIYASGSFVITSSDSFLFRGVERENIALHVDEDNYYAFFAKDKEFSEMRRVVDSYTLPVSGTHGSMKWEISAAKVLTVDGSGYDMASFNTATTTPWFPYRSDIKELVVNNCTSIGANAFAELPQLEKITIAERCGSIENGAFQNCTNLKNVAIGKVRALGDNVFEGCTVLETVDLGPNLSTMGDRLFHNCPNLKSIKCSASKPATSSSDPFGQIKRTTGDGGAMEVTLDVPDQYMTLYVADAN